MDRQVSSVIGLTVVVLIAGAFGSAIYLQSNANSQQNNPMIHLQRIKRMDQEKVKQPVVVQPPLKQGNKPVRFGDGSIEVSLEVPNTWLVETRYSSVVDPSVEQMVDFLATNYDGDIRTNPQLTSYYTDLPWSILKTMSAQDVELLYHKQDPPFPNATIAKVVDTNKSIWYTDWNADQIDFTIVTNRSAVKEIEELKKEQSTGWTTEKLNGLDTQVITFPTERERNKEAITKGATGGKKYFITIAPGTVMIIHKQAKGDVQFENDFQQVLNSLKISQK